MLTPGGYGDVVNHRADRAALRIDPVEVGVGPAAEMVVDVDGEGGAHGREVVEREAGAVDAAALEDDGGVRRLGQRLR